MKKEGRAMKRLLYFGVVGFGSALMFTMAGVGSAQADNGPHVSTAATAAGDVTIDTASGAGRCAGCHRAHTAKAAMLLKAAQPALCYSCHGGGLGANTDVQNGTSGSTGAALRGGGFEYALIGADAASKHMEPPVAPSTRWGTTLAKVPVGASEATTSSHQIDGTTAGTMWGNGAISAIANTGKAAVTLECGSCHDPHGNGNYRILKPVPDGTTPVSIQVKAEVPAVLDDPLTTTVNEAKALVPAIMGPGAEGVTIPDAPGTDAASRAASHVYTTTNYWSVVDRNVPLTKGGAPVASGVTDGYIANASQWCSTCHTRYLAQAPAYQTDSGDAVFTYRHTSNRIDKAGESRPNCIQCHVSHGSNALMTGAAAGVTAPGGAPAQPVGKPASSRLLRVDQRGTCVMCHNV